MKTKCLLTTALFIFIITGEVLAQAPRETLTESITPIDSLTPPPCSGIPMDEEIFMFAEVMPHFPGCEGQNLKDYELTSCANEKMYAFIAQHLVYPQEARENGIQGLVVARFVIGKDGSICDIKIIRSIGYGSDQAVINVLEAMPNWIPAYHQGQPVPLAFTMPFKFSLASPEKAKEQRKD